MELTLDEQEIETVRAALAARLEQLRQEWSRTEDRTYRHELFVTLTRLEALAGRLPPPPEPRRPEAPL
jgi:hypothetical protein